ncbi:helix-turn-helix transcriptional regulator [Limibacter armeniacum]|uniref:helix-turn-helix domain-containing protein n=1 Tax=Limibacter armeniacum TaxID=466084 RepID=UPI002FE563A0
MIKLEDATAPIFDASTVLILDFYTVSMKRNLGNKMKYGQHYYDFDEGVLALMSPGQTVSADNTDNEQATGWWLVFHPDFIRNYPLGKDIKNYGYFSYAVNEALHLSEEEEQMMEGIMQNIQREYQSSIDHYSQDVMVSHLGLLLNYSNRFYNRQFITRKKASNDLLIKVEDLLEDYFNSNKSLGAGLPSVQYISDHLNVSSNYLSDMLRNLTGQTTQQHIHNKLIEKAKELLVTTELTVGEIAYELGFVQPQSFNKLFKSKTNLSPLQYRKSFN